MTEVNPSERLAQLEREYQELKPLYECMVDEVQYILNRNIEKKGLKIHSITFRPEKIKSFKSVCDKLQRKNLTKCAEIEDMAGVRVICLYRSDLQKIGDIISECFSVVEADTSRTRTETAFGYASDHYIVKLSSEYKGERYDSIKGIKCEIQVRTLLMDAWASVSHHLVYKQEVDIPRDLRVDFSSLAGLFYVADTHFELFREGVERTRAALLKSIQHDTFDISQEINLETLVAYATWKFPERKHVLIESDLVSELRNYGYSSVKQIDEKVNIAMPFLKQHEIDSRELSFHKQQEKRAAKEWSEFWAMSGLIRHVLDLTDNKYYKDRREIFPKQVLEQMEAQRKQITSSISP